MKHNVKINGVIKEIDCKLGSDILDKTGREIFEGDYLRFKHHNHGEMILQVKFYDGCFLVEDLDEDSNFQPQPLWEYLDDDVEVLGEEYNHETDKQCDNAFGR